MGPGVRRIDRHAVVAAAAQMSGAFELGLGAVVARLAQWLPVRFIPEELPIATVRLDVINFSGLDCQAERLAIPTARIRAQEASASATPTRTIVTVTLGRSGPVAAQATLAHFTQARICGGECGDAVRHFSGFGARDRWVLRFRCEITLDLLRMFLITLGPFWASL
jgi:hypothetical protein